MTPAQSPDPDPGSGDAPTPRAAASETADALHQRGVGSAAELHAQSGSPRSLAAARLQPQEALNATLDRLADLAARLLKAPSAQLSVLSDVQVIAGSAGLPLGSTGSVSPVADSLCTVTAASGHSLVVADAAHDHRVAHLPPVTTGAVGAYLGAPLIDPEGHIVGALCVFGPTPRTWSPADVAILEQLAGAAMAEMELAALTGEFEVNRVVLDVAISAARIGVFDLDVVASTLRWDDRLLEMFEFTNESFDRSVATFTGRIHRDDRDRVSAALREAIDSCGTYDAEYRIMLPSGRTRWITARGRALCDEAGVTVRLLGAAFDSTAAREGEIRTAVMLESMSVGYLAIDRDWRYTYVNTEAERIVGRPRAELIGGTVWELFPAAVGTAFETSYRRAMDAGEHVTFDAYYPAPLDAWLEVRVWPSAEGLSVYFLDITTRRMAQDAAERAAARLGVLTQVAAHLADTITANQTVTTVPRLLVPILGDWCLITLVDPEDRGTWPTRLHEITAWHPDPRLRGAVERLSVLRSAVIGDSSLTARALRSEQPVIVNAGLTGQVGDLEPGELRDLLTQLAPDATAMLPLRGHGRVLGLLTVFNGADRGGFSDGDLATLREVAGQVGLALDNARLYAAQRSLAEQLQRSLLTALPEPDHLQITARYSPSATGAEIGGDWYDAFVVADGSISLVIGDVAGHDQAAAVAMAAVRNVLRGVAHAMTQSPSAILGALDRAMGDLAMGALTTTVLAKVEQSPQDAAQGLRRLHWSNAGHPPPLLLHPDGRAEFLDRDPDLLLGLTTHARRHDHVQVLHPGATVLLYTDGLVERRGEDLDVGLERLRAHAERLAHPDDALTLDVLCDTLLADLATGVEDDVALLALRTHPEDRPRPPGAGPTVLTADLRGELR